MSQVEVETQIMETVARLESLTDDYREALDRAAEAESDWKAANSTAVVTLAESGVMDSGTKSTVDWRKAKAELISEPEGRHFRITDAHRAFLREALMTYRARLDALRTLASNIRGQT